MRKTSKKIEASSEQAAKQLWTRKNVAEFLGVSISKVRTLEGKLLHPDKRKGVNYFDPEAVKSYAEGIGYTRGRSGTQSEGKLAARAFKMFSEGKNLREVVCALEIAPEKACELYEAWMTPDLDQALQKRRQRAAAKAESKAQAEHDARMLAQQKLMYKQQAAMSKEFDEMRERRKASIAKEMQQYQQRLKKGW